MDWKSLTGALVRWIHVVAGIIWIGHLYFFNFVNAPFQGKMDGDTKKKVNPELLPRALFWFRWGAAWTWVSGVILLTLVFYHGKQVFEKHDAAWEVPAIVGIAITFLGAAVYDILQKTVLKDNRAMFWVGFLLSVGVLAFFFKIAEFGYRGAVIHLGAMFGTTMAYNVWMRIWPAQKQIITAVKNGQAPDQALVALAGTRSKHNTYMSVPLIYAMLNEHSTTLHRTGWGGWQALMTPAIVILLGWTAVFLLYKKSTRVQGF